MNQQFIILISSIIIGLSIIISYYDIFNFKKKEVSKYAQGEKNYDIGKEFYLLTTKKCPNHPRTFYLHNDPKFNLSIDDRNLNLTKVKLNTLFIPTFRSTRTLSKRDPFLYNNFTKSESDRVNFFNRFFKHEISNQIYKTLWKHQRYSHFPLMGSITRKDNLYLKGMNLKRSFPYDINYLPETYIFPKDKDIFLKKFLNKNKDNHINKDNLWILKPKASSRGRGIKLLTELKQIENNNLLASKYISNPLLINNKKFDLRLYVLVTGFYPLKIYLYNEGFARFSSENYSLSEKDLTNEFIHLTNYKINKKNKHFNENEENVKEGHKWNLTKLKKTLEIKHINLGKTFIKIHDLLIKTFMSILDETIAKLKEMELDPTVIHELFGFDVLIDQNLKQWLIEVNLDPSMGAENEMDLKIKSKLNIDIANIIGIIPFSHNKKRRTYDKEIIYKNEVEEAVQESICEFDRPLGDFVRIFPKKNNIDKYKKYSKNPGLENLMLWDLMKKNK